VSPGDLGAQVLACCCRQLAGNKFRIPIVARYQLVSAGCRDLQAGSLRSPELRNHARYGPACLRVDNDHRHRVMLGVTQTDPCGFHRTLFGERLRSAV